MPALDRAAVHRLFLVSVAFAEAACARSGSPPANGDGAVTVPIASASSLPVAADAGAPEQAPTATPAHDAGAGAVMDIAALGAQFHSVDDLAKALPPGELLGFINQKGNTPACEPSPCPAEWTKAIQARPAHVAAVVRRKGAIAILKADDLPTELGTIDSPVKAALRMRLDPMQTVARCSHFGAVGTKCAAGSTDAGIPVRAVDGGFEVGLFGPTDVCPGPQHGSAEALHFVRVAPDASVTFSSNALSVHAADAARPGVECRYPSRGRMFDGFVDLPPEASLRDYHLRAYRQEAAAALAFDHLACELEAHEAPADLIAAARRAAEDERRHARSFRHEAERLASTASRREVRDERDERDERAASAAASSRDEEVAAVGAPDPAIRPLEVLLRENAIEGCVHETYAAAVATYQAAHAPTARLRAVFEAIAEDECAHAALAHRIHAWGLTRVADPTALVAALADERRALASSAAATPIGLALGEPSPAIALAAFEAASSMLLAAA